MQVHKPFRPILPALFLLRDDEVVIRLQPEGSDLPATQFGTIRLYREGAKSPFGLWEYNPSSYAFLDGSEMIAIGKAIHRANLANIIGAKPPMRLNTWTTMSIDFDAHNDNCVMVHILEGSKKYGWVNDCGVYGKDSPEPSSVVGKFAHAIYILADNNPDKRLALLLWYQSGFGA